MLITGPTLVTMLLSSVSFFLGMGALSFALDKEGQLFVMNITGSIALLYALIILGLKVWFFAVNVI